MIRNGNFNLKSHGRGMSQKSVPLSESPLMVLLLNWTLFYKTFQEVSCPYQTPDVVVNCTDTHYSTSISLWDREQIKCQDVLPNSHYFPRIGKASTVSYFTSQRKMILLIHVNWQRSTFQIIYRREGILGNSILPCFEVMQGQMHNQMS